MRRLLLALLFSAVCGPPAAAEVKSFRDWIAACDNTKSCTAYALRENAIGAWLRLEREGLPAAALRIIVMVDMAKDRRFTLAFDDPAAEGLPRQAIAPAGGDELTRVEIVAVEPFLAALRKATRILVKPVEPKPDDEPIEISLSGASAALLWIDEQQKRLGTVTALVRRGDRPQSAVPAPPPRPVVTAAKRGAGAPPKTLPPAVLAKGKTICGDDDRNPEPGETNRLSGDIILYWFGCRQMSGAYNMWSGLIVAPERQPQAARVVQLPYPPGEVAITGISKRLIVNGSLDEKTLTLTMFGKGRGPGDCGTSGEWVWDGKEFRLTVFRSMPKCGGLLSEDWPVIYRAQVRR